jgi:hypothetical protein
LFWGWNNGFFKWASYNLAKLTQLDNMKNLRGRGWWMSGLKNGAGVGERQKFNLLNRFEQLAQLSKLSHLKKVRP